MLGACDKWSYDRRSSWNGHALSLPVLDAALCVAYALTFVLSVAIAQTDDVIYFSQSRMRYWYDDPGLLDGSFGSTLRVWHAINILRLLGGIAGWALLSLLDPFLGPVSVQPRPAEGPPVPDIAFDPLSPELAEERRLLRARALSSGAARSSEAQSMNRPTHNDGGRQRRPARRCARRIGACALLEPRPPAEGRLGDTEDSLCGGWRTLDPAQTRVPCPFTVPS